MEDKEVLHKIKDLEGSVKWQDIINVWARYKQHKHPESKFKLDRYVKDLLEGLTK